MALKLKDLGIKIDPVKFKEITKLGFIDDTEREWTPSEDKTDGEWTPSEKEELRKEIEGEGK